MKPLLSRRNSLSFLVFVSAVLSLVAPEATQVYIYKLNNFKENIEKRDGNFIMFYAPWCKFCTSVQPIWEDLARMVNVEDSNFAIAQVDCTKEHRLCHDNDITGYPTLLYFEKGNYNAEEYRGTRDLPSMTMFLNERVYKETNSPMQENKPSDVKINHGMAILTEHNYERFLSQGQHFIMFYAPWCQVSQTLSPVWSDLGAQYAKNESLHISKINCMEYASTCVNFEIKDYPHLVWMVNGKVMEGITGQHTLQDLKEFVDRMARPENHNPDRFMKKKKSLPVAKISEDTFDVFMQKDFVFINYYAAWCAHCKLMIPTWVQLGKTFQDDSRIIIGDVDCAQEDALCMQEEIYHFPTLVLYKNSKVVHQTRGSTTLEALVRIVETNLKLPSNPTENTNSENLETKTKDEL